MRDSKKVNSRQAELCRVLDFGGVRLVLNCTGAVFAEVADVDGDWIRCDLSSSAIQLLEFIEAR